MWLIVAVTAGLALLDFGLWRIADSFPPRYRRFGVGESRQAVDHRFGRFGGAYERTPKDCETCDTSVATNPVPAEADSNASVVAAQIETDDDRAVL